MHALHPLHPAIALFFNLLTVKKKGMGATTSSVQEFVRPRGPAAPTGRRPKRARGLDDDLTHGPARQRRRTRKPLFSLTQSDAEASNSDFLKGLALTTDEGNDVKVTQTYQARKNFQLEDEIKSKFFPWITLLTDAKVAQNRAMGSRC
jgi:hypothetical protein